MLYRYTYLPTYLPTYIHTYILTYAPHFSVSKLSFALMGPAFVSAQNILESDGLYISRFLDRPNQSSKLTSLPACLAGVGFMGYHTYIYAWMRALLYAQTRMSLLCICLYHAQHSMCMHAYTHTYIPTYRPTYLHT